MNRKSRIKSFSVLEALLPLLFFSGNNLFYAALVIPVVGGLTLLLFELSRPLPRSALFAIYLLWLSGCGALGWWAMQLPPYWIWSVYILIPRTAWEPSDAQRKKPFLFGLKKYQKARVLELVIALAATLAFAGALAWLQLKAEGATIWICGILALVVTEIVLIKLRRPKL